MVDLEKLEAREKAATKGTVKVCDRSDYLVRANDARWEIDEESGREHFWIALCNKEEDARLYAALRNAAHELIAELRELRRDKERLDWLESVGDIVNIDVDRDLSDSAQIVSNAFTGVTVRAAIDAAIKQSPVEGKIDR